jgi:hypothetical protein
MEDYIQIAKEKELCNFAFKIFPTEIIWNTKGFVGKEVFLSQAWRTVGQ